jgi:hypothetical protein
MPGFLRLASFFRRVGDGAWLRVGDSVDRDQDGPAAGMGSSFRGGWRVGWLRLGTSERDRLASFREEVGCVEYSKTQREP